MKEYVLIVDDGDQEEFFYLLPQLENTPSYALQFKKREQAHEYKLALALGTYPTLKNSPNSYEFIGELYQGVPTYKVTGQRDKTHDEAEPDCCQSGCPGCPWTLEQIRLGNL